MKKLLFLTLLAAMGFAAVSCSDDDEATANYIFVHAYEGAPDVQITTPDATLVTSASYFAATDYISVEGEQTATVTPADDPNTTLASLELNAPDGSNNSYFIINDGGAPGAVTASDDLTAPDAGNAHVRAAHLHAEAPAVDVVVVNESDSTISSPVFSNASFKGVTSFAPVAAETVKLGLVPTGATDFGDLVVTSPDLNLEDGRIYTVVASGNTLADGVDLNVIQHN